MSYKEETQATMRRIQAARKWNLTGISVRAPVADEEQAMSQELGAARTQLPPSIRGPELIGPMARLS